MATPNIFTETVSEDVIQRIGQLSAETPAKWGKMNVSQMLAHCNVTYELVYTPDKHPKPGAFARLMLKLFVKGTVVTEKPYKQNSPTAPAFQIRGSRDFGTEKQRLVDFIRRVQQEGESRFDGRVSQAFGPLSKSEWNIMFYKHLHHHLSQFGV